MRYFFFFLPIFAFGQSISLTPANPVATAGSSITISADRPVTFQLTGAGSISVQNNHTITYQAPSSVVLPHVLNGCMVMPADAVFNTRIDNLPIHPRSAAWTPNMTSYGIAVIYQWGTTVVDHSAALVPQYFNYTPLLNGTVFPAVPAGLRHRETGAYTTDSYNDHHEVTVNHETCTFWETYQRYVPINGCPNCTAASGVTYPSTNYKEFAASTDAAGLPLAPLTVHLDEIKTGSIKHAMRFTSCAGCISQSVLWPATFSTGWSSSGVPMGARFRLKASFDISSYPQAARTVLTAMKQYGLFLADIGMEGQISFSSDVTRDASITSQLATINGITQDNFEVVDESSLMLSSALNTVNPNNRFVHPNNSALLTVIDSGNSANRVQVPIALQPVTVGTPEPQLTVQAATNSFPIRAWVNGSSNQNVTWSISPSTGVGSITASGMYTAPATVNCITTAMITATSQANPSAVATIGLTLIPAGTIRIDAGSLSATTDQNGSSWLPDLGFETGSYSNQNDWYPGNAWGGIPFQTQYQTYKYTWGDDIVYRLHVPNGNYQVTLMLGQGGTNGTYNTGTFDNGLIFGPMNMETQGLVTAHMWDLGLATNFTGRKPASVNIPAQVTNTNLVIAVRATTTPAGHSAPFLNGVIVAPDTAAPFISIDCQRHIVPAGMSLQLYVTDWFNSSNDITWTVAGGPGSISATGLYTAPLQVTAATWVTVRARDSVTGLTASYNLYIPAPGQQLPPGTF